MVAVFLFSLHFLAALYAFFKYKKESLSEGLLAVAFFVIVFSVGWTITTLLTNLLFEMRAFTEWYHGETNSMFLQTLRREFNRDTLALLLLTFAEVGLYSLLLGEERKTKKPTSA